MTPLEPSDQLTQNAGAPRKVPARLGPDLDAPAPRSPVRQNVLPLHATEARPAEPTIAPIKQPSSFHVAYYCNSSVALMNLSGNGQIADLHPVAGLLLGGQREKEKGKSVRPGVRIRFLDSLLTVAAEERQLSHNHLSPTGAPG